MREREGGKAIEESVKVVVLPLRRSPRSEVAQDAQHEFAEVLASADAGGTFLRCSPRLKAVRHDQMLARQAASVTLVGSPDRRHLRVLRKQIERGPDKRNAQSATVSDTGLLVPRC